MRSQLVLPAITGFLAYLDTGICCELWEEKKNPGSARKLPLAASVVLTAVCVAGAWHQTQTTQSLYYTERCCYEQDAALGRALITRLEQVQGGENLPVVVIGSRSFSGNNACVIGEMIGKSFFEHDADVEPVFFWSTRRILGFLHTLGADYRQVDAERIPEAMEYSTYMPEWPAENSVQIHEGMIVVKLSHFE